MKIKKLLLIFLCLLAYTPSAFCKTHEDDNMKMISNAFLNGKIIPKKYTCDGDNISPPIAWMNSPVNTKSFVLIVDDPDAPHSTWDHWILFNIPATVNQLDENITALPRGAETGKNSWGNMNYGGPCPPSGIHRYVFKLYALDTTLPLQKGAKKNEVVSAMKNHIIAQAELLGKYERE